MVCARRQVTGRLHGFHRDPVQGLVGVCRLADRVVWVPTTVELADRLGAEVRIVYSRREPDGALRHARIDALSSRL